MSIRTLNTWIKLCKFKRISLATKTSRKQGSNNQIIRSTLQRFSRTHSLSHKFHWTTMLKSNSQSCQNLNKIWTLTFLINLLWRASCRLPRTSLSLCNQDINSNGSTQIKSQELFKLVPNLQWQMPLPKKKSKYRMVKELQPVQFKMHFRKRLTSKALLSRRVYQITFHLIQLMKEWQVQDMLMISSKRPQTVIWYNTLTIWSDQNIIIILFKKSE